MRIAPAGLFTERAQVHDIISFSSALTMMEAVQGVFFTMRVDAARGCREIWLRNPIGIGEL